MIKANDVIVFQGDSITDCGRTGTIDPQNSLGIGYAKMVAQTLSAQYSSYNLKFFNRGLGGAKVDDMFDRWDKECMALKPTIVTVLIGINDVLRSFDSNEEVNFERFEKNLGTMFDLVKKSGAKLIVLEPFTIPHGIIEDSWRHMLNKLQIIERRLAAKYASAYIPLDGLFASASITQKPSDFTNDGVHPIEHGHRLITRELLKVLI